MLPQPLDGSFHGFGGLRLDGPNPPPVEACKQRLKLRMVYQHQPVLHGGPGEAVLFQPLAAITRPVPSQYKSFNRSAFLDRNTKTVPGNGSLRNSFFPIAARLS